VLLADDHKILRQGLRTLLEQEEDIHIVGEADNGRSSVKLAGDLAPDVVIMDKLGLRSVAELTKYAIREGITTLDR